MGQEPVAALVLGAAVWAGGVASPTLRRRAELGARVVLEGRAGVLVACGGLGKHGPSEAEVIGWIAREAGVAEAAIRLEDRSTTTAENIRFALPILRDLGITRVILVTDRYHAPRALLIARRLGLEARAETSGSAGTRPRRILYAWCREAVALARFLVRGV